MTDAEIIKGALKHADKNGYDFMPEAYEALNRLETNYTKMKDQLDRDNKYLERFTTSDDEVDSWHK